MAAVVTGSFGPVSGREQFAIAAVGGLAIGAVVALIVGSIRSRVDDPYADTALSLLATFVELSGTTRDRWTVPYGPHRLDRR